DIVDSKRVFAACEHGFAVHLYRRGRAVDGINKPAVRVDVNRPGNLPSADIARLGQSFLPEHRSSRKYPAGDFEHVELVLPFERDIDPRPRRMEIEMTRPETVTAVWRDRRFVAQQPVLVLEYLERTWVLRFSRGGVMTACDEDRQTVVGADPHLVPVNSSVDRSALTHHLTGSR